MTFDDKVQLAAKLWAAWSSGNPDAPGPLVTDDFDLNDTAFGHHKGWANARDFFSATVGNFPDLVMRPVAYFENPANGDLALTWVMTGTYAPTGKSWSVDGMSTLAFRDGKVSAEVDYYDGRPVLAALPPEVIAALG
jgi:steroid delta-isomerase-like uncharacterized protein